jgi:hypothetical protein
MKEDEACLRHILDAIARIESYVAVGHEVFMSVSHWQDAVIRQEEGNQQPQAALVSHWASGRTSKIRYSYPSISVDSEPS